MDQARQGLRRAALVAALVLPACVAGVAGAAAAPGAAHPTYAAAAPAQATDPAVRLTVVFTRDQGVRHVSHLRCTGARSVADGFLRDVGAARACARARRVATMLTTSPQPRACTQIYGGPERANVTGHIGTRRVARRFSRTNGCQIADWTTAQPLLPRAHGAVGP